MEFRLPDLDTPLYQRGVHQFLKLGELLDGIDPEFWPHDQREWEQFLDIMDVEELPRD